MKIQNQHLIEEYYEKVKDEYPDMEFEELKKIVTGPFIYLKEEMASEELPTIRLKYLGVFLVHKGRAEYVKNVTKESYKKGNITKKLHDQRIKLIDNFLEKRKKDSE